VAQRGLVFEAFELLGQDSGLELGHAMVRAGEGIASFEALGVPNIPHWRRRKPRFHKIPRSPAQNPAHFPPKSAVQVPTLTYR